MILEIFCDMSLVLVTSYAIEFELCMWFKINLNSFIVHIHYFDQEHGKKCDRLTHTKSLSGNLSPFPLTTWSPYDVFIHTQLLGRSSTLCISIAVHSKLSIDLLESYQAQEAYVPWIVNQLVCVVGGVHHMTLLQGIVSWFPLGLLVFPRWLYFWFLFASEFSICAKWLCCKYDDTSKRIIS